MAENNKGLGRRDFLKAAATIPVVGGFAAAVSKKETYDKVSRQEILDKANKVTGENPNIKKRNYVCKSGSKDVLKIGYIGIGGRGKDHMISSGIAQPDQLKPGRSLGTDGQEPLNIVCTAVCDLFQPNVDWALHAAGGTAKAYSSYQELLEKSDVDVVLIATPDHYHAPIAIAAAEAGKHVYVEKCMTNNIPQAFALREAVKRNGIVFQLGHQNRNSNRFDSAMEVVDKGLLGNIHLIQCYTNRNSHHGAWYYDIPKEHGPINGYGGTGAHNLDWEQYLANVEKVDYDPNRFFRWRCYWDYGTGLSGDLLTHELDVINMVMNNGIPKTAVASGGVYHFKEFTTMMTADGEPISADQPLPADAKPRPDVPVMRREVPDVFQVTYEWPERDLTVVYNATLGNERNRGQIYLGDEATMDLTDGVDVYADPESKRYADLMEAGKVRPDEPMISYRNVAGKGIEAITSATSQWTVQKGLLYTYRGGKRVDTTYLHIKNWLDHVRDNNHETMCDIDDGFQESITAHMANVSLRLGCRVRWDEVNQQVINDATGEVIADASTVELASKTS